MRLVRGSCRDVGVKTAIELDHLAGGLASAKEALDINCANTIFGVDLLMANTLGAALSRLVRSHCDSSFLFLCRIVEWGGNFSEVTWPSLYPLSKRTQVLPSDAINRGRDAVLPHKQWPFRELFPCAF
jgi:hypothetical protein